MERFRKQISQLMFRGDLVQAQMPILHRFMSEVLPNVSVLGTLATAHDVVCPFNACRVVLVHSLT